MSTDLPDWTDGVPRLVVESCGDCAHRWYFRRPRCPSCGSVDVRRRTSAGAGTVAAATVLHSGSGTGPLGVCLVDLDDGVRVMARCVPGLTPATPVTVTVVEGLPHAAAVGG